jgi:ATPase subunit of ABC transporter with duplicated ATPase domains
MSDRTSSAASAGAGMDLSAAASAAMSSSALKRKASGAKGSTARRLGIDVVRFDGARLEVTRRRQNGDDQEIAEKEKEEKENAAPSSSSSKLLLLDDFTYAFSRGERVGVVGHNGAGKTSFLRLLVGDEDTALTGGFRSVGETVKFGYYDQRGLVTDPGVRVLDFVVSQVSMKEERGVGEIFPIIQIE